jgi:hypothetical protein
MNQALYTKPTGETLPVHILSVSGGWSTIRDVDGIEAKVRNSTLRPADEIRVQINALRQLAQDCYEQDGGVAAECWGADDYMRLIGEHGTAKKAWKFHLRTVDAVRETQAVYEVEDALPRAKYAGPMLALRAAAKSYTRPANGNPCCGDGLAEACGAYTREVVVKGLIAALNLPGNPYLHLNPGQQSMNLRNKTRQALKAGTVTLEQIESALNVAYITSPEFKA